MNEHIVRCAVYTRKSTDEGLEKEFNSLEAQREAGESYIKSQKHQGWILLPDHYDDGGFSGGNMNRPALTRLLDDVKNNKIDMIVVYKIDRLTRALTDFSKLVEVFDAHNCSFVSVTQNFNTSDSMGRLTLNMLLSFAQFEREVGAERIRDKVAASRKKGMWMGGAIPFGYHVENKKLIVSPDEAKIVQMIYDLYCTTKSELEVCAFIKDQGWQTEKHKFRHAQVSYLLRNPIYTGKVVHKGNVYEGQQEAIIDQTQWNLVQKIKAGNKVKRFTPSKVVVHSLLQGLLECGCGCHSTMTPTHTSKNHRTYEYYVSYRAIKEGRKNCATSAIPAGELDKFVTSKIQNIFYSPKLADEIARQIMPTCPDLNIKEIFDKLKNTDNLIDKLPVNVVRLILKHVISKVVVSHNKVIIHLKPLGATLLKSAHCLDLIEDENTQTHRLEYDVDFVKKKGQLKIYPPTENKPFLDETLLNAVVKAYTWRYKLEKNKISLRELARMEKIDHGYIAKIIKLTCLAPDIIESIMIGNQPPSLKITDFIKDVIPLSWVEQRQKYGFQSGKIINL